MEPTVVVVLPAWLVWLGVAVMALSIVNDCLKVRLWWLKRQLLKIQKDLIETED